MKAHLQNAIFGRSNLLAILIVFGLFAFVGLGCRGSKTETKPIPAAYLGDWEGQDGSTISIRANNSGDYHAGSTTVDNGTAEVDETAKTVSFTFVGIGKTLTIDQAPSGDQMKLSGVVYRRKGGFSTTTTTTSSSNTSSSNTSSPPTFPSDTTSTSSTPQPPPSNPVDSDAPSGSETTALVKESVGDFAEAIEKEDFTAFRATTSKDFQVTNSAASLKGIFQTFIDKKDQVLPSLNSVSSSTASFSDGPRVRTEKGYKILVVTGTLSTSPNPVQFEMEYELEKGTWKILKIKLRM